MSEFPTDAAPVSLETIPTILQLKFGPAGLPVFGGIVKEKAVTGRHQGVNQCSCYLERKVEVLPDPTDFALIITYFKLLKPFDSIKNGR